MTRIRHPATLPLVAALAALTACEAPLAPDASAHSHVTVESPRVGIGQLDGDLLGAVRRATSRFSSTTQATAAGYVQASGCVAAPGLGGMGFHWSAPSLIDPVFDPLQPEALLYEPRANGGLELVAVEYIVVNVGQPAPTFAGQAFDVGGTPVPAPHWSLHVWLFRENPNGTFVRFNPAVTCS